MEGGSNESPFSVSFRLLIYSGNFVAKLVFARRIFPALGNANEFSLLSLNGKIVMSKTAYHITLKGYVGGYDFDRSTVDRELAKNEGKQVNITKGTVLLVTTC